jgi:hypothetical protein
VTITTDDVVREGIRIVRAQERLAAMLRPMEMQFEQINEILEDAPELGPELNEVLLRLGEIAGHLRSACAVLQAKVDLW